jgi:hypothetical protein
MKQLTFRFLKVFFVLFFAGNISNVLAQNTATIYGKVNDENEKALEAVTISVIGATSGTYTDNKGNFELKIPADSSVKVVFSYVGFKTEERLVNLSPNQRKNVSVNLKYSSANIVEVTVEDKLGRSKSVTRIDPKSVDIITSVTGGVEAILKTLPGVSSNNELSSQYMVRGGNFDENLVYVNDIEIYRPLLVRGGQQEGLSFVNNDMVSSIVFSAGGFDAKYGDKMASVLDIRYRKPRELGGSFQASLLGASLHTEGASKGYRFTYQVGVRQKSNQYLLGNMEMRGDYAPSFTDVQSFLTYDISEKWEINFLGNISRNVFRFVPTTRETEFGYINEALRFTVFFEGQEVSSFNTFMGALSSIHRPNKDLTLKFIASSFRTIESETFDINGAYRLDELERDLGSEEFGEAVSNRGVGEFLNHARNQLKGQIYNLEHRGYLDNDVYNLKWGIKGQTEIIDDKLREWNMVDSAGYSVPRLPSDEILLQNVIRTDINLQSTRMMGFVQNSWYWGDSTDYSLTAGIRTHYWSLNNQTTVSPRISFSMKPNWKRDIMLRAAAGYYHQPPFYRELRGLDGSINKDIKAQTSIHFVVGSDYNFKAWDRPFKFVSELYFKHMENLIPYEVDNVRIRYYAENNAVGYATGIDLKVNGEFIKGIDSWASLSVMQTKEDILDDFFYRYINSDGERIIPGYTANRTPVDSVRIEPGYIPRPTDQRYVFGLFFQDYLPKFPDFKMNINMLFGARLPFGPPSFERYRDTLRMPPYRRVDLGFSYQILSEDKRPKKENSAFKNIKSMWVSLDVFNLLDINNTISYLWIRDAGNRQYAVPNYLTPRLINLRLVTKF